MSEQYPEVETLKETAHTLDWRAQRQVEKESMRAERRELRRNSPLSGWIGGGTLIIVGLAYLARNILGWEFSNHWWAIFMLIPALSALATAWTFFRSDKPNQRRAAIGLLVSGGFMLIIATALFFSVSWQLIWPLFLILIGMNIMVGRGSFTTAAN
jgi:hypothetical protein